ncbi:hypothetical protein GCM10007363_07690 [Pseudomonas fluvialis]|uniref:Uncharacterized protein n=1 Tax=Pseudomonas fluvialis TaxID=1793966 RepID=A0ABQ2ADZ2_9PSED|nr:hypothetical protein GCM10007363_07690 [Pseudomonas fluvialis]
MAQLAVIGVAQGAFLIAHPALCGLTVGTEAKVRRSLWRLFWHGGLHKAQVRLDSVRQPG